MSWFTKFFTRNNSSERTNTTNQVEDVRLVLAEIDRENKPVTREDVIAALRVELATRNLVKTFASSLKNLEKQKNKLVSKKIAYENAIKNNNKPEEEDASKREAVQQVLDTQVAPAIRILEEKLEQTRARLSTMEEKLNDLTQERASLQAKYVLSLPLGEDPDIEDMISEATDTLIKVTKGKGAFLTSANFDDEETALLMGQTETQTSSSESDDNVSVRDVLTDEDELQASSLDSDSDDWDDFLHIPKSKPSLTDSRNSKQVYSELNDESEKTSV